MTRPLVCLLATAVTLFVGCGDDDVLPIFDGGLDSSVDATPIPDAGPDIREPDAEVRDAGPIWGTLDTEWTMGEGERRRLDIPEGVTAVVTTATVPARIDGDVLVVFAPYDTREGSIELTLSMGGMERSLAIALTIESIAWGPALAPNGAAVGPSPTEHASHILDEGGDRMIVMGGSGYSPQGVPTADIWVMDLATGTWSEPNVDGVAPARGSMRVAHEEGASFALLFGGYATPGDPGSNEVLRVDFSEPTIRIETVPQSGDVPRARSLHSFSYDSTTETYWLFGGIDGPVVLGDLYSMQLTDGVAVWTRIVSEDESPSARYGFFYGFDDVRGRLYVYSGARSAPLVVPAQDFWMLDVRAAAPTWTKLLDDPDLPLGRRNGSFTFDPRGPRLWIYGGTPDGRAGTPGLFAIDVGEGETGEVEAQVHLIRRPHPAPIRSSGFGLFDVTRDRVLLGFGNDADVYSDVWPLVTGDGASTLPDACVDLGDACTADSCSTICFAEGTVDLGRNERVVGLPDGAETEFPAFAGGYCTPVAPRLARDTCDPASNTDECGPCAECVNFGGRPMCARGCDPSAPGNGSCRDGYACDPDRRVCVPGCASDEQCRFRREESNGEFMIQTFDDCRDNPARCPAGPDRLVYSTEGNPTCNMESYRCEYTGTEGAEAGDACTTDGDCEDSGYCDAESGRCSRAHCDLDGTCAGEGVCISRSIGNETPSFCGEPCTVGTGPGVDASDPSTWLVGEGGCRPGDSCVWDGVSPAGVTNGYCAPIGAGMTPQTTPNLGGPCTTNDDCFSPFGRGACEGFRASTDIPSVCVFTDCDAPGLPPLLTEGTVCLHLGGFDGALGLAVPACASAEECSPERACTNITGEGPVCIDVCLEDSNCRANERCDATLRGCVPR